MSQERPERATLPPAQENVDKLAKVVEGGNYYGAQQMYKSISIITLSVGANKLSKIQERAEEYAALIMEEIDPDNLGYIELYNLEMLLLQGPSQSSNLRGTDSRVLSQLPSQKLVPTKEHNPLKRWYKRSKYFVEDNWRRIWVLTLWLAICAGLFTWKFIQYKNRAVFEVMGYCVTTWLYWSGLLMACLVGYSK